jgi:hypothetical protein
MQSGVLQSVSGAKEHPQMNENEIVIPLEELIKLEVSCECGSGAVFAFNKDTVFTTNPAREGRDPARSCPSCNTYFGTSVLSALMKWHELVSFAQNDQKFRLKFHVPQSSGQPEQS